MSLRFYPRDDLTSWGRVVRETQTVAQPAFVSDLEAWGREDRGPRLASGLLRSYGDSNLFGAGRLIDMRALDRVLAFDTESGLIRAQAGLSLDELLRIVVPLGWFAPVTPGSRMVTLGGAVANDVHGKNHYRAGTFGRHVRGLCLMRSDQGVLEIGPGDNRELFAATVGGLGLTGVILDVTLQLVPIASAFLDAETVPLGNLNDFFAVNAASLEGWEHTVAWIDCTRGGARLGVGLYSRANWSGAGGLTPHGDKAMATPMEAPGFAINPLTLAAGNRVYRWLQQAKPRRALTHYSAVFHPLDGVRDWNKLYGRAGFYQYQCVVPQREAIAELLAIIARSGEGSVLAVLKSFGDLASPGLLSFPRPGYTLALDFRNRGTMTQNLMAQLDAVVRGAGGALYPAKDGRMPREMFELSFPALSRFRAFRDPACGSDFARRMGL